MSKTDQRNIILRLILLGVFFWIGSSTASAIGVRKSIDTHRLSHLDVFVGQKAFAGDSSDNQGSAFCPLPALSVLPKSGISSAKLRYDEIMVGLRIQVCHQIYIAVKEIRMQIQCPILNLINKDQPFTDRIS